MINTTAFCLAFWMTATLASTPVMFAQASAGAGAIAGAVSDSQGAAMPDVELTARNVNTNALRAVRSNAAGRYELVALHPGEYEITAAKPGFAALVRQDVIVAVGQRVVIDLIMQVSSTIETITVAGNASPVETDKTEVSTVINLRDMMHLPLNGRRWDTFVMTTPGVSNDGGAGLITFRGISGNYNNNMIDGMDNNQAFFGEAKGRTQLAYGISPEAIQEFHVGASNLSVQYGRAAGGTVNAVTKSGTNDLHGNFFYLIRDNSLNALNSVTKAQGLAKPQDRRQQFGPSVGGALKRDTLFYFFSYDQQKRTFPAVVVPDAANFLASACTSPGCDNAVAFYRSLEGPQDRKGNQYLGLARIDWNATARHQVSSTVNILRWDSPNGLYTAPTHRFHSSANGSDLVKNETVITRWNWMAQPNFVSELRLQRGRDLELQRPNAGGPYVTITNGIDFGMPGFLPRPAFPDERRWQIAQNLSWLRGRHAFRFGYDVNWIGDQITNLFQGGGVYSYPSLNDFALDCVNPSLPLGTCRSTPTTGPRGITGKHYTSYHQAFDSLGKAGTSRFTNQDYAFYFEDNFKPSRNLTLNVGLRYELETMPKPDAPNLALPGTGRINTDTSNFAPRVGLAWDPFKKQRTVLRVGAGMYYGRIPNATISSLLRDNGRRLRTYEFLPNTPGAPVFPQVLTAVPQGISDTPDSLFAAADFANPLTYQMEFTIEQQVFQNFTLAASYLGTRGQRFPLFRDMNLFSPTETGIYEVCAVPQPAAGARCPQVERTITVPFFPGPASNRPNRAFGRITVAESVVNSWYNALVLQAKHRFSRGFQMQASFTLSKAQDNGQFQQCLFAANQPLNPLNLRDEYALSNLDQWRRFTLSAYWMLPFHRLESRPLRAALDGFQLSTIVTLADGRPYSPLVSGNPIPMGISTGVLGAGGSSRVPFVGRNVYTSPGLATADLRLSRAIRISERLKLELIAEGFNIFNRVNVTAINPTQYQLRGATLFPLPSFGSIAATGTNLTRERQLQVGARFSF